MTEISLYDAKDYIDSRETAAAYIRAIVVDSDDDEEILKAVQEVAEALGFSSQK